MQSASSLPSLPSPLLSGIVALNRVFSIDQIEPIFILMLN